MAANDQPERPDIPSGDELPPPAPAHPTDLTAKCHCGRVSIEIPSLPTMINECRCSICYRYGAEWAYYHPDDVNIVVDIHATRSASKSTSQAAQQAPPTGNQGSEGDKGLQYYVRDDSDGLLGFYFCGHCGCLTHWAPTEHGLVWLEERKKAKGDGPGKKMGVNTRMLPLNLLDGVNKRTGPFCEGELSHWN